MWYEILTSVIGVLGFVLSAALAYLRWRDSRVRLSASHAFVLFPIAVGRGKDSWMGLSMSFLLSN